MRRRFNTAGPCRPELHYMIPAVPRLPQVPGLVDQMAYFAVHAPRQTGKTTTLQAIAKELTLGGRHAALHVTCEVGRAFPDDVAQAERAVWSFLEGAASRDLSEALRPAPVVEAAAGNFLGVQLKRWAEACPRPLVLVLDEIDALSGPSLLAVLSQLRAGFPTRPTSFPGSIIVCGMRDVRDYKAASGGDPTRLGTSSPFNIKLESLRVGDFTDEEVRALFGQHTDDTGQRFTDEALSRAFALTRGQPWLTNALGREVVEKMAVPASETVTLTQVEEAKERLILARATHLDSLVARLYESRVRRFIEPLIAGTYEGGGEAYDDDLQYVRDLGLVTRTNPISVANPIYREVIVRVLAGVAEPRLPVEPRAYVGNDGRLEMGRLMDEFAAFWRENGEVLATGMPYPEVAPQLVLMAYLQRVVNGGGQIDREYGVGRGRIDLLIRWPYLEKDGQRAVQRAALELKVWRDRRPDPLNQGLAQLDEYLARLGLDHGILVIFDGRTSALPIEERTELGAAVTPAGRAVTLLRG